MQSEEVKILIKKFRNAAIEKGDFAKAKRDSQLYEIMRDSYHRIKKFGRNGEKSLESLLDDESVCVRVWIAAALMIEGNSKARKVVEELSKLSGITGLDAKITLQEFDKGNLTVVFPKSS